MNELYNELAAIYEMVSELINRPIVTGNSLEIRFRAALQEQKQMLEQALPLVQQEAADLLQLRQSLTVIYHDEEAAAPIFQAWKRGALWMKSAKSVTLDEMDKQMTDIKQKLDEIIPAIQQLFGREQARYIVPTIYRPEQPQMEGVK